MPGAETLSDVSVEEWGWGSSELIVLAVAMLRQCFLKWVMCGKRGSISKATELDGIISVLM